MKYIIAAVIFKKWGNRTPIVLGGGKGIRPR